MPESEDDGMDGEQLLATEQNDQDDSGGDSPRSGRSQDRDEELSEEEDADKELDSPSEWVNPAWKRWLWEVRSHPLVPIRTILGLLRTARVRRNKEKKFQRLLEAEDSPAPTTRAGRKLLVRYLREKNGRLSSEVSAHAATNKQLESQVAEYKRRLRNLDTVHEGLNKEREQLVGNVDELAQALRLNEDRVRNLQAELASALQRISEQDGEMESLRGEREIRALASALAKPPAFTGKGLLASKGGQQVEDWFSQVEHYVGALGFSQQRAVSVAVSLLQDEAARAWAGHVRVQLGGDVHRAVLADVKTAMLLRFAPAATNHTSRMELDNVVLGKGGLRALAAHVAEFDRVCALISDLGEAEKRHRFVMSIQKQQPHLVQRCCQDPLTSALYDSYDRMRTASLNAAAHAAEFVGHVEKASTQLAQRDSERNWKRPRTGNAGAGGGAGSSAGGNAGAGSSGGNRNSGNTGRGQAVAGGDGMHHGNNGASRPHRSKAVFEYCRDKGRCLRCYEKGHKDDTCENPMQPRDALPPGYTPGMALPAKGKK